jgi:hypothetical protein
METRALCYNRGAAVSVVQLYCCTRFSQVRGEDVHQFGKNHYVKENAIPNVTLSHPLGFLRNLCTDFIFC